MNKILIILLILTAFRAYSQEGLYKYSDFDCSESFLIKSDSFVYKHSCGFIFGEISGTVKYVNDTLLLNSNIQPSFTLKETFDSTSNNDTIVVTIKNVDFPNHYGLRVIKGDDYYDLNLQDRNLIVVMYDNIENSSTYSFTSKILSRKENLCFILYRTNLEIEIDWKNSEINQFEIEFNDLPDLLDYHFFTNKKVVINQENLILLDKEGKVETTRYIVKTKKKIKVSKNKKVKNYKKST
ncbi:MAG: hypothetical protein KG029_16225 [Bacteroidetes bacterium]|nr:hypothetical protein [Bacteroidota bacterium]